MPKFKHQLVMALAIALCVSACGNRAPANAVTPDDPSASPDSGATTPATPATPIPVTPTAAPTAAPITGSLVVSNVAKTKTGIILFKTMTVTGSVVNSSNVALQGNLKCDFKKNKGIITKTVETTSSKTLAVPLLQPGQSYPFTFTADEHNDDDAEVTVDTTPPAASATTSAADTTTAQLTGSYGYGY